MLMELNTMENGKMINSTVMEWNRGLMGQFTREATAKVKKMEKED